MHGCSKVVRGARKALPVGRSSSEVLSEEVVLSCTLTAEGDSCNIQFTGLTYDHFDFEVKDGNIWASRPLSLANLPNSFANRGIRKWLGLYSAFLWVHFDFS